MRHVEAPDTVGRAAQAHHVFFGEAENIVGSVIEKDGD